MDEILLVIDKLVDYSAKKRELGIKIKHNKAYAWRADHRANNAFSEGNQEEYLKQGNHANNLDNSIASSDKEFTEYKELINGFNNEYLKIVNNLTHVELLELGIRIRTKIRELCKKTDTVFHMTLNYADPEETEDYISDIDLQIRYYMKYEGDLQLRDLKITNPEYAAKLDQENESDSVEVTGRSIK